MDTNHNDVTNSGLEKRIVDALERIAQAFRVILWDVSKEYVLTPIQIQVLLFLRHHSREFATITYLSSYFNLTKATVSETVKTLEHKILIYKSFDAEDNRSFFIRLTEKGKEVAAQTSSFSKAIQQPIDQMSAGEKEGLFLSLVRIIQHLNQSGIVTVQRMCFTCSYYSPMHNGEGHYCRLLNQPLSNADLRIDCPEHSPQSTLI